MYLRFWLNEGGRKILFLHSCVFLLVYYLFPLCRVLEFFCLVAVNIKSHVNQVARCLPCNRYTLYLSKEIAGLAENIGGNQATLGA
ncbi:hypothetical protein VNO80_03712 [Phaseolus coccineus]|uniref:Uncharacterized protein n=1 Tax=Phaseolus coccineus TaxID=3886 RepID=A0AAN9RRR6_PHACN